MFSSSCLDTHYPSVPQIMKLCGICRSQRFSRTMADYPLAESIPVRNTEESSQEDCFPFFLDDDSSGPEGSPSFVKKRSSMKSAYGFSPDAKDTREATSNLLNKVDFTSKYSGTRHILANASFRIENRKVSGETLHEPHKSMDQRSVSTHSRGTSNLICSISQFSYM